MTTISDIEEFQLEKRKEVILRSSTISETLTGKQIIFINKSNYLFDRKLIKKGIIDGKERFYDTLRKRLVSKDSSGYVRAFYAWEFTRRYKPHRITGWFGKKNGICKHCVVSVRDNTEHENFYTECKIKGEPYHIFIPFKIGRTPKEKRHNIRHYYKKGIPVANLSKIFIISESRIYRLIKDINSKSFDKCIIKKVAEKCKTPLSFTSVN